MGLSEKYPLISKQTVEESDEQVMWISRTYRKQMYKGLNCECPWNDYGATVIAVWLRAV